MKILAIETSCDETAVAVVEDGRRVLANVIASQVVKHAETGGVVPEVAAREHIKAMIPCVQEALGEAGVNEKEIDAIAVTREPGLVGSLIVGRMTAAALAFAWDKPLTEVNHIHGHIYSTWLDLEKEPEFPILVLTVSGGHNDLVLMRGHGDMDLIGETLDDAAGEAFDKTARLLGLGYPGGPAIEEVAKGGNSEFAKFPRGKMEGFDFSFSGLKTAVLYFLQDNEGSREDEQFMKDVAASFQETVADILVGRLEDAVKKYKPREVHLTGGVSANRYLRGRIEEMLSRVAEAPVFRFPIKMAYCTDNAAMIGAAGYFKLRQPGK